MMYNEAYSITVVAHRININKLNVDPDLTASHIAARRIRSHE